MGPNRRLLQAGAIFAEPLDDLQDLRDRYDVNGLPTIVNSKYGRALNLNGIDQSVTIAKATDEIFDLSTFSIIMFINPTAHTKYPIAKRGTGQGINILIDSDWELTIIDAAPGIKGAGQIITAGKWQPIGITVDDTVLYTYLNGVEAGPITITAYTGNLVDPLYIGQRTGAGFFAGGIAHPSMFPRVLSAQEMLDFANEEVF